MKKSDQILAKLNFTSPNWHVLHNSVDCLSINCGQDLNQVHHVKWICFGLIPETPPPVMQSLVRGFVSQSLKMDPLEKVRRWKRSLDGYVSFRKAVLITLCCLAFILYVGPSIFSWLFLGSNRQKYHFYEEPPPSCINDKLGQLYHQDLAQVWPLVAHYHSAYFFSWLLKWPFSEVEHILLRQLRIKSE